MKKTTEELLKLLEKQKDVYHFLDDNEEEFVEFQVKEYLNEVLEKKGLKRADVVKNSGLDRSYVYHIFSGERENPSRNKMLAICIAMDLTTEETQRLLRALTLPILYPRNQRDSIILFGLNHHLSVMEVNEHLYELSFELLE